MLRSGAFGQFLGLPSILFVDSASLYRNLEFGSFFGFALAVVGGEFDRHGISIVRLTPYGWLFCHFCKGDGRYETKPTVLGGVSPPRLSGHFTKEEVPCSLLWSLNFSFDLITRTSAEFLLWAPHPKIDVHVAFALIDLGWHYGFLYGMVPERYTWMEAL